MLDTYAVAVVVEVGWFKGSSTGTRGLYSLKKPPAAVIIAPIGDYPPRTRPTVLHMHAEI
jgi:hypothetical protein